MHTHTKEIRKEILPGFQAAMKGEKTWLMAVSPGGFTHPGQLVTQSRYWVITQCFYCAQDNRLPSFPALSSLSAFTGFCSGIECVFVVALITVWPCTHCQQTSLGTAINNISIKREAQAETSSTGAYVWIKMSASLSCFKAAHNPGDKISPIHIF